MEQSEDFYFSISSAAEGIYREKASKFIAVAIPVSTEEEAKEKLEVIRKQYFDANHHCYAYRLGPEGDLHRSNDDGEPSGSAGKPIYGQILSAGLSDILVVVTRYFGGTKLGVPGLIHAYKTSAREAIDQAPKITKVITRLASIEFSYEMMNSVMRILKDENARIISQESEERCRFHIEVRKNSWERVQNRLSLIRNLCIQVI